MLTEDEATLRQPAGEPAPVRLLPSGDTFCLLQGADRELLVPEPDRRKQLVAFPRLARRDPHRRRRRRRLAPRPARAQRPPVDPSFSQTAAAVEAEAAALPLPGVDRDIVIHWADA
ncbi:MAG: hypothetical protein EOL89_13605 [Actinobacteria bacterium]|nr:hypothetical protein [Actinomycetota bacterium]